VVAVAPPVGVLPKCLRCGGTIYAAAHNEEDDMGHTSFVGFEMTCLACARVAGYVSLYQLQTFYGVPREDVLKARFATLAFFQFRDDA
jgi:hypothetical protein